MKGLTLDTGILIAFEKRDRLAVTLFTEARTNGYRLTVSSLTIIFSSSSRSDSIGCGSKTLNVVPARFFIEHRLDETVACPADETIIFSLAAASDRRAR